MTEANKDLPFTNVSFGDAKDFSDSFESSFLIDYAIKHAIDDLGSYYGSSEDFYNFFGDGKLLSIWNRFPERRYKVFHNLVVSGRMPWQFSKEQAEDINRSYRLIAKSVYDSIKDSFSVEDSRTKLSLSKYLDLDFDYLSICKMLEEKIALAEDDDDKTAIANSLEYWQGIGLDNSKSSEFFEYVYFGIKRAPGSTAFKKRVIEKSFANEAFSDKIIEKVVKSSPISLKRSVVSSLCDLLSNSNWEKRNLLRAKERNEQYDEDRLAELQEKVDQFNEVLIMFAPVADRQVQRCLVDNIYSENLVWLVPSVSQIGSSWLSKSLERRMSK